MTRKLIIDGNAVYEIDEDCMLTKKLEGEERSGKEEKQAVQTERENRKGME